MQTTSLKNWNDILFLAMQELSYLLYNKATGKKCERRWGLSIIPSLASLDPNSSKKYYYHDRRQSNVSRILFKQVERIGKHGTNILREPAATVNWGTRNSKRLTIPIRHHHNLGPHIWTPCHRRPMFGQHRRRIYRLVTHLNIHLEYVVNFVELTRTVDL